MIENKKVEILENVIKQMLNPIKNIPLYLIVESICGNKILEYDLSENEVLRKTIKLSANNINKNGIKSVRPNKVGNYAEPYITKAFESFGFNATIPITNEGEKRSAGYPDIYVNLNGKDFYIECKTYNKKNIDTTQRSFYLSPNTNFKVTKDAYHLIFAYSIIQVKTGIYKTDNVKILDAKNLLCDVKYEFNSDNKRMYGDGGLTVIYEESINVK